MLTHDILHRAFPHLSDETIDMVLDNIQPTLDRYQIDTPRRVASFLGQCAHESGHFRRRVENLNYSAEGLLRTFPKYFGPALAARYAKNPRKIASRAYANGPEATGDGYTYRGRGFIQLTGKINYSRFALSMGLSMTDAIAYLETPEGAFMSAGWLWDRAGLNALADEWRITDTSVKINGGRNGLRDRINLSNAVRRAIEG